MNREPMNGPEQNRSMKNDKQDKKNCERNPNAAPPFSSRGGIFLLINFHEHFTLWTGRERARGERCGGTHPCVSREAVRAGPASKRVSPSRDPPNAKRGIFHYNFDVTRMRALLLLVRPMFVVEMQRRFLAAQSHTIKSLCHDRKFSFFVFRSRFKIIHQ